MTFCYLNSPFFYNAISLNITPLKLFLVSSFIKATDLHERHRTKMSFIKKEHVRTLNSMKLKMSHIFYC